MLLGLSDTGQGGTESRGEVGDKRGAEEGEGKRGRKKIGYNTLNTVSRVHLVKSMVQEALSPVQGSLLIPKR